MKNKHNLKEINVSFDNERNELLIWIPLLIKEKLNTLSTEQLRTLHYILGYNCKEEPTESLIEEFEGYGYGHEYAAIDPEAIFNTIKIGIPPLLTTLNNIVTDIENGKYDFLF